MVKLLVQYVRSVILMKGDKIFDSPFVAFDHSEHSLMLLDIIDSMKASMPRVTILHVHNPKKNYLFDAIKGSGIYKYLKARYPQPTDSNVNVELKQQGEKNTNLLILESFVAKSSSILFLGFVGSKGLKPRSNDLSSRIRQFVYESKFNLAIVKTPNKHTTKVLFLLDGSETSFEGLNNAIVFCQRFGKALTVLHSYSYDLKQHSKVIKTQIKAVQDARKDTHIQAIFEERALLQILQEKKGDYEWIILNRNGYRGSISKQRFVGSNASRIIQAISCNLIILA